MKKLLVALLPAILCFSAIACNDPRLATNTSILKMFAVGDFVPHIPTVADVKLELGPAQGTRIGQDRVYTYRVALNGWITFRPSEALEDRYAGVEEVIYSSFPPTPDDATQKVRHELLGDKLMGIGLGDAVSKLNSRGIAFRKKDVELFGRKMTAYECTPLPGQDDLFYRYFILDNRVQAFSMGVTE